MLRLCEKLRRLRIRTLQLKLHASVLFKACSSGQQAIINMNSSQKYKFQDDKERDCRRSDRGKVCVWNI